MSICMDVVIHIVDYVRMYVWYVCAQVNSAFAAWGMRLLQLDAAKRQKEEDDRNNVPEEERQERSG